MSVKSLWPKEFGATQEPGPVDILNAQISELEKATDGKLTGRVDIGSIGDRVSLDFMIVAPTLSGYEYRLFQVLHRVYPAFLADFVVSGQKPVHVKTRDEFETQLARVLRSQATIDVVSELLQLIAKREKNDRIKKS